MNRVIPDSATQTETGVPETGEQSKADVGRVLSLSLGHMVNDFYSNMPQVLVPFIVAAGLGVGRAGFLATAFTITSSLTQPWFGLLADRHNRRWLAYAGTAWMSVLMAMLGLTTHYGTLLALCALGGLGTAVFHPTASAMTAVCSGQRKGFYQAIWMAAGNIGWAITPPVVAYLVQHGSLRWTPVLMIPGLTAAALLAWNAPAVPPRPRRSGPGLRARLGAVYPELIRITTVTAGRSITYFSLVAFVPLYLKARGVSTIECGWWLFATLFAGSLGGLAGGFLSDQWAGRDGRRRVVIWSLLLASLFLNVFCMTSGLVSHIALVVGGTFLMASFSVTVVLAHQAIGASAALASGLIIGFAVGMGGLGLGLVGALAERHGIGPVMRGLVFMPLLAGLLAITLKRQTAAAPAARETACNGRPMR